MQADYQTFNLIDMREKTSSWKEQMQTHRTHPYLVDVLNLPSVRQQNYKWEWQWQINNQQPVNLRCIYSIECKDHTQFPVLQTQRGNIGKTGSDHHVHPCPLSAPRAFSVETTLGESQDAHFGSIHGT